MDLPAVGMVATAEQMALGANLRFDGEELGVSMDIVMGGPPLTRLHAAAQGRGTPIMKRTSHVEIHVQSRKEQD